MMLFKCVFQTPSRRSFGLVLNNSRALQLAARSSRNLTSLTSTSDTSFRSFSTVHSMEAWSINTYGSNDLLELGSHPLPRLRRSTDILVRVHAASVNPIDFRMRSGYGQTLLNLWRKLEKVDEFPLILGRDFSGEVVKTARLARRFKEGDQVWGTPSVIAGGTHGEYVVASQDEISIKPSNWTHSEAASVPYVACTVWTALVSRAGLKPNDCYGKRVLVLGGSGGIGSIAIQLLKAWGAYVASTCSPDAVDLVAGLGADLVVDYSAVNAKEELKISGGFDVILDPFGGEIREQYASLLSKWKGSMFVTLAPPVLRYTDKLGASLGLVSAGQNFASTAVQEVLCSGSLVSWGFFSPNGAALDQIRSLCQSGMIKPVVQEVFPFSKTNEAYAILESGHARGKIVISMDCKESAEKEHSV